MTELKTDLTALTRGGWKQGTSWITKQFSFETFGDAFAFMTRCALEIEKRDHHPEWTNVYNKITVNLSTHDVGDVTMKDVELARFMDKIASAYLAKE